MREIKYRAYHKKKERLVDVLEINFEYNTVTLSMETDSDEEYYWWSSTCHLDEVELMQYTGLTDKNGVEIYGGDIVKAPTDFGPAGFEEKLHEVKYDLVQGYGWNNVLINHIEVIGNIYQHKHLLKENE